jgi:hypothetical protein
MKASIRIASVGGLRESQTLQEWSLMAVTSRGAGADTWCGTVRVPMACITEAHHRRPREARGLTFEENVQASEDKEKAPPKRSLFVLSQPVCPRGDLNPHALYGH